DRVGELREVGQGPAEAAAVLVADPVQLRHDLVDRPGVQLGDRAGRVVQHGVDRGGHPGAFDGDAALVLGHVGQVRLGDRARQPQVPAAEHVGYLDLGAGGGAEVDLAVHLPADDHVAAPVVGLHGGDLADADARDPDLVAGAQVAGRGE